MTGVPQTSRWSFGSKYLNAIRRRKCRQKHDTEGDKSAIPILGRLVDPPYLQDLAPVHYAYDWLPKTRHCAAPSPFRWPPGEVRIQHDNSFALYPTAANFPWPTGLIYIRQSIHWRESLSASSQLLELFARDDSVASTPQSAGLSLASIANKVLKLPEEDRFTRFSMYLFPQANSVRVKLLAETIVLIIVFDGMTLLDL